MKVKLAYGRTGLEVELPEEGVSVIEPRYIPGIPDEQAAIREALASPIGSPALADLVKPHHKVAITFPDVTRPCPTDRMLPAILEAISAVPRENVVLISGTGMHRPNTDEEMRRIVGPAICDGYRVINHNAFDKSTLALAGKTSRGTEMWVNAEFLAADVKILVGFIEPHMFAGFSGGAKAILPGIAGEATVLSNHDAEMIGNSRAIWGITKGNPIFEEMREAALLAKPTFLCNVTLNRDKQITNIFFGDMIQAHNAGIKFARETAMRPVPKPFDIVVTTNSGYPLDQNLYQTIKGASAANLIVADGGAIISASECSDGLPEHGNYKKILHSRSSLQEILEMICAPGYLLFDQWEAQIQANIQKRAEFYLYSTLDDKEVSQAHVKPTHDIAATVRDLKERYGPSATIAVLPEGPFTIPYVDDDAGKAFEAMATHGAR
ncbi:MAG TPA: nickel-dependent lactate racemase [Chloroflexota bacterium]